MSAAVVMVHAFCVFMEIPLWPAETSVHQTAAFAEAACTADEVNAAFTRAKTCVDGRASARPAAPRNQAQSSSERTAFCKYVAETSSCFEKCACGAVDYCDSGKAPKAVAPLATQEQRDLFEGVCNSWNDNNCIDAAEIGDVAGGEFRCGSAAGLRAGAFTTLLVAAFALLLGH